MSSEVQLRCRCGKVRGLAIDVGPQTGNRVVCYCDDCQAFARFLGHDGVLDAAGGSDIFQMAPARMRITEGAELLRAMRLTKKGLIRWYTECCRTPVANTVGARPPFVGVIDGFMDHAADGRSRDEVLGAPVGFFHGRFAVGGCPAHAHPSVPLVALARMVRRVLGWWVTGKGSPSPFFDSRTGAPRAEPHVLNPSERDALRRA